MFPGATQSKNEAVQAVIWAGNTRGGNPLWTLKFLGKNLRTFFFLPCVVSFKLMIQRTHLCSYYDRKINTEEKKFTIFACVFPWSLEYPGMRLELSASIDNSLVLGLGTRLALITNAPRLSAKMLHKVTPLYRTCCGQHQVSSAVLGWPGEAVSCKKAVDSWPYPW